MCCCWMLPCWLNLREPRCWLQGVGLLRLCLFSCPPITTISCRCCWCCCIQAVHLTAGRLLLLRFLLVRLLSLLLFGGSCRRLLRLLPKALRDGGFQRLSPPRPSVHGQ